MPECVTIAVGGTACVLLPDHGPALVDCGADVHLPELLDGLAASGCAPDDLRTLLLTHVHLDHAGAAGSLTALAPQLEVVVHERGARHLVDPSRLMASARQVFGARLDTMFGEMRPVPADRLVRVADEQRLPSGIEVLPTPGHARHHITFQTPQRTCFAGDVAGFHLDGTEYTEPHTPPPDIDLIAWRGSLAAIAARAPAALCVSHLGWVKDPLAHLARVGERLEAWAAYAALGESVFRERVEDDRSALPAHVRAGLAAVASDRRSAFAGLQMALSRGRL